MKFILINLIFFITTGLLYPLTAAQALIALSPDEKTFLEAHPTIRVANEMDWPPFDFVANDVAKGYSIDLLGLIAEKTGLEFEYVNGYSWDTLLKMGKHQELDVFPAIWWTKERDKDFNFTSPYIDTPYILVVHRDTHDINDIDSLEGRTLTGIKGFASTELVQKYYPGIHVVAVASAVEGLRQVLYGKADAYLGSMAETNFAIKNHLVPDLKIAAETTLGGRGKSPLLYIGVRKDWPVLIRIIQRGMDAITQEEKQQLQAKWLNLEGRLHSLVFDEVERRFLQQHPVLRVGFAADWPPVEYLGKDGNMTGIAADYLARIKMLLGVEIEPVSLHGRSEMVAMLKQGRIDFLSAFSYSGGPKNGIAFTDVYLSYPIVIVTREDVPYIGELGFLEGKSIAVVEGYAAHELLRMQYPTLHLLTVPGVKEGLLAVANKEAFAFVGSLATVSHVTGRESLTGLKVSGETQHTVNIAMATQADNVVLRGVLQKALAAISLEERNAIYSKWSQVTFEHRIDYTRLWQIGAAVLALFALILYWNRRLRVMAAELKVARDAAETANKAKDAFLANMSHELRTPLNAILGFSQMMVDDATLGYDQKENLRIINSSGEHLLGVLNDILEMAKIEAGHLALRESVFNLQQLLQGVRDMLNAPANAKGLYIEVAIHPGTPDCIKADKDRVRQVLANLVVNGVKYTRSGGVSVSVRCASIEDDDTHCSLEFEVRDTGPGIDPQYLDTVFDPFVQLEPKHQYAEGCGLGLSICRTLVHRMQGDIRLTSEVGKGSCFCFTIRVQIAPAQVLIEDQEVEPATAEGRGPNPNASTSTVLNANEIQILREGLRGLPAEFLTTLKDALFSFDYEMTLTVIDQIREYDPSLADKLFDQASGYRFGILQQIFKNEERT